MIMLSEAFFHTKLKCTKILKFALLNSGSKLSGICLLEILVILCLMFCCQILKAQILYDSPPVGVSLTRPVLPWLARYFVNAGNKKIYFLDEPQRGPSEEGAAGTEVGGGNREADDPQAGGPAQAGGPPQTGEPAQTGGPAQLPPQQGVINQPENIPPIVMPDHKPKQFSGIAPVPVPVLPAPVYSPTRIAAAPSPSPTILSPPIPYPSPMAPLITEMPIVPASSPVPLPPLPPPLTAPIIPSVIEELPEPQPIGLECPPILCPLPCPPIPDPIPLAEILPNPKIYASPLSFLQFKPQRLPFLPKSPPISMLMSGSPKSSNPNFSFRDAVLSGATPPTVQLPMHKFLTTLRRFNG